MTREEAKQNTWRAHCNFDDPRKAIHIVIDQIFDYFENELQNAYKQGIKDEARCHQPKDKE